MAKMQGAPTHDQYQKCAQTAHEYNEIFGSSELAELLERETDHAYACQIGVWYWQLGHRGMAILAYQRSLELQPEAPTYYNLAVCHDDLGNTNEAVGALCQFYELVQSTEERKSADSMLRQNRKEHLIKAASKAQKEMNS